MGRPDWKSALSSVKGVYIITDASNGRHYIGSAYGVSGIWSRWDCYIGTGHGWNDGLIKLIRKKGKKYARDNFRFSILEVISKTVSDDYVLERETFWKNALCTRKHGYNKN